jgi:hypothetical protein
VSVKWLVMWRTAKFGLPAGEDFSLPQRPDWLWTEVHPAPYEKTLHWHGTCGQTPPSYWLVVLGKIKTVPNGYTAEKLPVLRRQRRRRTKGPLCLIYRRLKSITTWNRHCYTEYDEPIGRRHLPIGTIQMWWTLKFQRGLLTNGHWGILSLE